MKIIIFTDLDGSLLNHDNYSFSEAIPAINRVRESEIPLIIVTSKTRREVESIQQELRIKEPFVVENGAAIYFPNSYKGLYFENDKKETFIKTAQLGISYGLIRSFMNEIKDQFKISGFGDLTLKEISSLSGLSLEQAELAMWREFTEPFIMNGDQDMGSLQSFAAERGMKVMQGGRFYHMMGMKQDKGEAVKIIRDILDRGIGEKHLAIGIGDSANDLSMLKNVDIPIVIPCHDGTHLGVSLPRLVQAHHPGSRGWNESVEKILDKLIPNPSLASPNELMIGDDIL